MKTPVFETLMLKYEGFLCANGFIDPLLSFTYNLILSISLYTFSSKTQDNPVYILEME